ncbi:hypothetical protein PFISCL1PPCAC_23937, partial [Pristionchus fissidentatus]
LFSRTTEEDGGDSAASLEVCSTSPACPSLTASRLLFLSGPPRSHHLPFVSLLFMIFARFGPSFVSSEKTLFFLSFLFLL